MNYSIQTGEKILYIHTAVAQNNSDEFNVQLFHVQLVKGIPSFKLQDIDSVIKFINGFLFGELEAHSYVFYCTAMESIYFGNDLLLQLFNVRKGVAAKRLTVNEKNPLDNRRALR